MRVFVACERSGVVRRAFAAKGHDAWSCDIEAADDGHPNHFQGDAIKAMVDFSPDLLIAHPPCTVLAVSGAWASVGDSERAIKRRAQVEEALAFFKAFLDYGFQFDIPTCVENPVGITSTRICPPDQWVQPWQFGHDASKKTGLWLYKLPKLIPTNIVQGRAVVAKNGKTVYRYANQTDSGQNRLGPSPTRAAERSKTYEGIAAAMADQWGNQ